jgi:serine/threonine protein kinase
MASLSFSPRYAAPEVLRAFENKEVTVLVDTSMDMWSLGVMAFELLTDAPAFPRDIKQEDIIDQLVGRKPLPWEQIGAKGKLDKLRMLRRSLVKCLSRNPSERPTAKALLMSWNRLFDNFTGEKTTLVT